MTHRPNHPGDGARVDTFVTVTRHRPAALARALDGFSRVARGRRVRILVGDDGDEARRAETIEVVHRCARRHGVDVRIVDRAARARMAERLAHVSGAEVETVRFAVCGDGALDCTIGANRNALLLACAGGAFLSFDDDVVPSLAALSHDVDRGSARLVDGDPTRWSFFRDRDDALAGVARVEVDLIGAHEEHLGRAPASCAEIRHGSARAQRRAQRRDARIVASLTGVFGDCGMHSGLGLLLHGVATRLDAETFARAKTSREVLRVAARASVGRPVPFMGTSFALDARTDLPPFLPVARNEDGVFGATLDRCFEGACAVHLPYAVLHDAERGRTYARDWVQSAGGTRLSDLLLAFLSTRTFDEHIEPNERLRALGKELAAHASSGLAHYRSWSRDLLLRAAHARLQRIELLASSSISTWARDDLLLHAQALRAAIASDTHEVAIDLLEGRSSDDARTLGARLCAAYGRLLEAWPAILAAARALGPSLVDAIGARESAVA